MGLLWHGTRYVNALSATPKSTVVRESQRLARRFFPFSDWPY
jgi:hypothetical protein